MQSVSAHGTHTPSRGARARVARDVGRGGRAREVEPQLVGDVAQRRSQPVLRRQDPRARPDSPSPPARKARSAISTSEARQPIARCEQPFLAGVLQQEDRPRPRHAALRASAPPSRGASADVAHRGIGDRDRLEAIVRGQLPRDVVVGLAAVLREVLRREQVHGVVPVRLVEPHHVGAGGEARPPSTANAACARPTSMRWSSSRPTSCATRRRSPWSSGITNA